MVEVSLLLFLWAQETIKAAGYGVCHQQYIL